jgi:hypothetical protein
MKVLHQIDKDLELKFAKEFEAHKRTQMAKIVDKTKTIILWSRLWDAQYSL